MAEFFVRGTCAVLLVLFICGCGACIGMLIYEFFADRRDKRMQVWKREEWEKEVEKKNGS